MAEQVRHVTIVNSKGLHARASARLARLAANLETPVQIEFEGATADARSIMDLLCLGAAQGMQLNLIANGDGAEAALKAVETLIEEGFGELGEGDDQT